MENESDFLLHCIPKELNDYKKKKYCRDISPPIPYYTFSLSSC